MSKIEEEILLITTEKKQRVSESRQEYLYRLMLAAQKLPEDEWDKISNIGQEWSNSLITAYRVGNDLPDFPDIKLSKRKAKEDEEEPEKVVKEEKPKKEKAEKPKKKVVEETPSPAKGKKVKEEPSKKKANKKKEEPKEEPKASKKKPTGKKGVGCKIRIKELLIDDPQATVDDIFDTLKSEGISTTMSTVQGIRAEFRHSLKFLKSKNLIKLEIY